MLFYREAKNSYHYEHGYYFYKVDGNKPYIYSEELKDWNLITLENKSPQRIISVISTRESTTEEEINKYLLARKLLK